MSSPSPDELKRRAQEIAVRLAARAQEVDRLRRPADESIRELEASGLLSFFVPREHGGLELDLGTYCHVAASLGEGCTSTAWVAVFYMIHGWIAAQFPAPTRRELFSDHPWFLAPGALAPTGRAVVAHGGYRVSGRWQWATGVAHAEWLMVTALVEREDAPEPRMFILPIAHAKIEDTWFTDGMRGTASHDVIVDDALVPEDRSLSLAELGTSGAPGAREHSNPLYRLPMVPQRRAFHLRGRRSECALCGQSAAADAPRPRDLGVPHHLRRRLDRRARRPLDAGDGPGDPAAMKNAPRKSDQQPEKG